MLIFSPERFIGAHSNRNVPYYNWSYDRLVRDVMCSACGASLGEQVKVLPFDKKFEFESNEKNRYKFCPYCGEKL